MVTTPDDVLTFWFGEPAVDGAGLMEKVRRWFMGGPALDGEVSARFGDTVEAALAGQLDGWADTARGRLALVILLDQLTRNVFRNLPRMYAGDAKAQQLALDAFDRKLADELEFVEKTFLSMPLLHAEDLTLQRRLAEISHVIGVACPPLYTQMLAMNREQIAKYTDIIERFGRFPHRNEILGRQSTPEEVEFLRDWAERAPPSGSPRS